MNERTLLVISIVAILIGLPVLIFLSIITEDSLNNPENILLQEDPDTILTGKILRISKSPKITRLTIAYDSTIPAVLFEETDLKQGDIIKIRGQVETYQGKKQLRIEKIKNI